MLQRAITWHKTNTNPCNETSRVQEIRCFGARHRQRVQNVAKHLSDEELNR